MVDLLGDLALNATDGHSGIPVGHIVAYKPSHQLATLFVRALRERTSSEDWVPVTGLGDEDEGEGEEEEEHEEEAEVEDGQ